MPAIRTERREKKARIIEGLAEDISQCSLGILLDYRGLSTQEATRLRRYLREAGLKYKVVKNTLAGFAIQRAGREGSKDLFVGPVAVVFGYNDVTEPAKVLLRYINEKRLNLPIKGGFTASGVLTPDDITMLSRLPSREELLSQVVTGFSLPLIMLIGSLMSPIRGLVNVLHSRMKQLKEEEK